MGARLSGMSEAFWMQRCPARGVALTHAFGKQDTPGRCAHCGFSPSEWATATGPRLVTSNSANGPMPPMDLNARLRALGMIEPEGPDDHEYEPKMARGIVTGDENGPGRGDLTSRQKQYLLALKGWVDWLDRQVVLD